MHKDLLEAVHTVLPTWHTGTQEILPWGTMPTVAQRLAESPAPDPELADREVALEALNDLDEQNARKRDPPRAGREDRTFMAACGVRPGGNWEGKNILALVGILEERELLWPRSAAGFSKLASSGCIPAATTYVGARANVE